MGIPILPSLEGRKLFKSCRSVGRILFGSFFLKDPIIVFLRTFEFSFGCGKDGKYSASVAREISVSK